MDCNLVPNITDQFGNNIPSGLFTTLVSITKNREFAKEIYKITLIDEFKAWDPILDMNGEPQIIYVNGQPSFVNNDDELIPIQISNLIEKDLESLLIEKGALEGGLIKDKSIVDELNKQVRRTYDLNQDVITVAPNGTYSINAKIVSLIDKGQIENEGVSLNEINIAGDNFYYTYKKLSLLKLNTRNSILSRINNIDLELKRAPAGKIKDLVKEQEKLRKLLVNLNKEIAQLNKEMSFNSLAAHVDSLIARMNSLYEIGERTLLKQAYEIANFLIEVNNFSDPDGNILFLGLDIALMSNEQKNVVQSWMLQAKALKENIEKKEADEFFREIAEDENIKKTYGESVPKKKDIIAPKQDISQYDYYINSPEVTTLGKKENDVIPGFLLSQYQSVINETLGIQRAFEGLVDKSFPKAAEELKKLGHTLSNTVISNDNVAWDAVFFQKDYDGLNTGTLIRRYNYAYQLWQDNLRKKYYQISRKSNERMARKVTSKSIRMQCDLFDFTKSKEVYDAIVDDEILRSLFPEIPQFESYSNYTPNHYKEIVEEQIKLLKKYRNRKVAAVDIILEEFDIPHFNTEAKAELEKWEKENSPLHALNNKEEYNSLEHIVKVPKQNSGFYDENFSVIDNNKELYEFRQVADAVLTYIHKTLPVSVQNKLRDNAIPMLNRNLIELIAEGGNTTDALSYIKSKALDSLTLTKNEYIDHSDLDPATNIKRLKVNDTVLTQVNKEAKLEFTLKETEFLILYNKGKEAKERVNNLDELATVKVEKLNQQCIDFLANIANCKNTPQGIRERYKLNKYAQIPIRRIIENYSVNKSLEYKTLSLPKLLKLYSNIAADYNARQQILPLMETGLSIYKRIPSIESDKLGRPKVNASGELIISDKEREKAVGRLKRSIDRNVIGNWEGKEYGVFNTPINDYNPIVKNILLTKEDKQLIKRIEELKCNPDITQDQIIELEQLEDRLGKSFVFSRFYKLLLNLIRLKGLGWNLGSALINYLEGHIANEIAVGSEYTSKSWYWARGMVNRGKKNQKKTYKFLLEKYALFQDASNEFQRADIKVSLSRFKFLHPYAPTRFTEEKNQSPVMLAIMKDTVIMKKDGTEGNLADAFDFNKADGSLTEEYNTPENIENWVNMNGKEFDMFKAKVDQSITKIHGDYSRTRGNAIKDSYSGKSLMMFKGWVPRSLHKMFGKEQEDILLGTKDKGILRSESRGSLAIHGGIFGLATMGFPGIIVGATIGAFGGQFLSKSQSTVGFIEELAVLSSLLIKKMVGIPLNRMAAMEIIDTQRAFGKDGKSLVEIGFSQIDARNLNSLMTMLSFTLTQLLLVMLVKGLLDDDDDPTKKQIHNLLVNRLAGLINNSLMYVNPFELYDSLIVRNAAILFTGNTLQLMHDIKRATEEHDDIILTGVNAGESRVWNDIKKTILPTPLKFDELFILGQESSLERQFKPTPFDKMYESDAEQNYRMVKAQRAKYNRYLKDIGITSKKERKKLVDKKFKLPKKP